MLENESDRVPSFAPGPSKGESFTKRTKGGGEESREKKVPPCRLREGTTTRQVLAVKQDGSTENIFPIIRSKATALAFKVTNDKRKGPLVFFRVYSGVFPARHMFYNTTQHHKENPSKLLRVFADSMEEVSEASVGDVYCVVSGDNIFILVPFLDGGRGLERFPPSCSFCTSDLLPAPHFTIDVVFLLGGWDGGFRLFLPLVLHLLSLHRQD